MAKRQVSVPVAIVGAGPGGLYSAMRLVDSGAFRPEDIAIFDAQPEIGGRVRTLPLGNIAFTADVGAMRYIAKRQLIINSIITLMDRDGSSDGDRRRGSRKS